jgi:adenine-specific DNA-methyltransferase
MAKSKKINVSQKPIEQYEHKDKDRLNNPPVGLVDAHTDNGGFKKKTYEYDPHLDPQLQWAGKSEHTSFDVPTVSLHVHERIDPRRIIESVKKEEDSSPQMSLFEEKKKPLREAIEFYKHRENWSNRLIAGDSLLVMNSLLEKEGMGGKVQMVFFDPPYGIKYGSNFMPFVNKREVKNGNDGDLTAEPEMLKAFRDTWELGIHSYLTYLRDRLLLSRDLLTDSGCVYIQISDENLHHIRELGDEIFGVNNFISLITFTKAQGPTQSNSIPSICDYLIVYAKDREKYYQKYRQLYRKKILGEPGTSEFRNVELSNGEIRRITNEEYSDPSKLPEGAKIFATTPIVSQGYSESNSQDIELEFEGKKFTLSCGHNRHWSVGVEGTRRLWEKGRLLRTEGLRIFKSYLDDFPYSPLTNVWADMRGETEMSYVVQTNKKVLERCILMSTDPGDLVLDITCGSGTTAIVAEQWGRRWITCDTSRIALTLAKQRLMTASFDYYKLSHNTEGVGSGFMYNSHHHIVKSTLAHDLSHAMKYFYDDPVIDKTKARVTGPFTCEAVPAPMAKSFDDLNQDNEISADLSISRTGETLRQDEWRNELFRAGVRAKGGNLIEFTRVEPLLGSKYLQAEAETREDIPKRVVVCFGPEHAPLEQRMVELALDEARTLKPKPDIILFCAFHFDPEARKDIEETNWPGMTLLEAQMNADLLTEDLKKKRSSNESFWLIGQPDVSVKHITSGEDSGKITVEVLGFDYYNPKSGSVDSGGKGDIAMWMLDHDYDGRSLLPSQVFFPMAGAKEGWATLAKNLKAEIDEDKIEAYNGTVSLPFKPGNNIAVKIIDARGIESLKIIRL